MRLNQIILFLAISVFFSHKNYSQYITTDENYTAQQLVEDVLINNPCAIVSNFSVTGGDFGNGEKSYARFYGTGTTFPFQNGVVLSTGKAANTEGPNSSLSDDGSNIGWNGDQDLQQALGLNNSFNATVLEFDFIPIGNKFSFDYIFSSEQYLLNPTSNQCNFTDGFAFLLKEDGTTNYINLALVPNTNIPVKVNTVRGNGTICPPANEQYFDAFNGMEHPTNFNGQTKVMTAQADVTPGTDYHIKIVIADEGNARFDSAIFLDAGSFDFGVNLGDDRLIATGNPLCENETLELSAIVTNSFTYQWYKDNQPLTGEIAANYIVLEAGIYKLEMLINGTCSYTTSEIEIEYAPPLLTNQTLFYFCDVVGAQDGLTTFDMDFIKSQVYQNLPSNYTVGLFDSLSNPVELPNNYINLNPYEQVIYAKITNIQNCYLPVAIILRVTSFDLGTDENPVICGTNSLILSVPNGFDAYSWNTTPVQTSSQISITTPGNYSVTITNSSGCTATKLFTVALSEEATITDIIVNDFSDNNTAQIIATGSGTYEYSIDGITYQESNLFTNLGNGTYTAYVKDTKGCGITSQDFQILDAPNFFTPNGDGQNDLWFVPLLALQPRTTISIFDRNGKLIYNFRANQNGWNGTFGGFELPAADYWYVISFINCRIVRGHFSLIR